MSITYKCHCRRVIPPASRCIRCGFESIGEPLPQDREAPYTPVVRASRVVGNREVEVSTKPKVETRGSKKSDA